MKKIYLSGKDIFALVDDEDYVFLNRWPWHLNCKGYAVRGRTKADVDVPGGQTIFMHRVIAQTPKGMYTDHIDNDKLNNQRSNLRWCTNQENTRNRPKTRYNTSGYKGVTWNKPTKSWRANIAYNGKRIYLGLHKDVKDAARAYNAAAEKLYGDFAQLNEV